MVDINEFDMSMYPYLLNYSQTNECKESVEKLREAYFNEKDSTTPLTEEECNRLRDKLGASFVLDSYSKQQLRELLNEKKSKRKVTIQKEEDNVIFTEK